MITWASDPRRLLGRVYRPSVKGLRGSGSGPPLTQQRTDNSFTVFVSLCPSAGEVMPCLGTGI